MKMTFLEAARNLGLVKCDKHFYYNNGSTYLADAKAAVRAGVWPVERLEGLLQERCWIRKLRRCFAKHGFGRQTRRMVAEYNFRFRKETADETAELDRDDPRAKAREAKFFGELPEEAAPCSR